MWSKSINIGSLLNSVHAAQCHDSASSPCANTLFISVLMSSYIFNHKSCQICQARRAECSTCFSMHKSVTGWTCMPTQISSVSQSCIANEYAMILYFCPHPMRKPIIAKQCSSDCLPGKWIESMLQFCLQCILLPAVHGHKSACRALLSSPVLFTSVKQTCDNYS